MKQKKAGFSNTVNHPIRKAFGPLEYTTLSSHEPARSECCKPWQIFKSKLSMTRNELQINPRFANTSTSLIESYDIFYGKLKLGVCMLVHLWWSYLSWKSLSWNTSFKKSTILRRRIRYHCRTRKNSSNWTVRKNPGKQPVFEEKNSWSWGVMKILLTKASKNLVNLQVSKQLHENGDKVGRTRLTNRSKSNASFSHAWLWYVCRLCWSTKSSSTPPLMKVSRRKPI